MQAKTYHTTSARLTTSLMNSEDHWVLRQEYEPVPRPAVESNYYKKVQALIEAGTECCINCIHLKIENCMVAADISDVYNYLLVRCNSPRCPTKSLKKGNVTIRDLFMGYRFILKERYSCYE